MAVAIDADSDVDQGKPERPSFWTALGRFPTCPVFSHWLGTAHQRVGGTYFNNSYL